MKKQLSLVLALTVMASTTLSLAGDRQEQALNMLQSLNIMSGFEDGLLHENAKLTRAQAASMIMRASGFDDAKWYSSEVALFGDLPLSHWASGYVYKAVADGIIAGVSESEYCPDENVRYEQAVKMLVILLGYGDDSLVYPDGYLEKADEIGLLADVNSETGKELTRGQFAILVDNALSCKINSDDGVLTLVIEEASGKSYYIYADDSEIMKSAVAESSDLSSRVSGGGSGGGSSSSAAASGAPAVLPAPIPGDDSIYIPEYPQQIEAGQLTAGRWNDINNYDFWLNLMQNEEYYSLQQKWEIPTEKHEVKVTDNGIPAKDCIVELKNENGEIIWTSRTDKDGRAYVFTQEYSGLSLTAANKENTATVENPDFTAGVIEIELSAVEPEDIVDLMFTIDTTGSMSDELMYIKEELKDIVIRLDTNVRVSCNYYRDVTDSYVVRPFDFTTNIDRVIAQISGQYASGGGDYEEAVDLALLNSVNGHDWSESARSRLLFLVLDAPPHFTQEVTANIQSAVKSASEKGIRIIPVASSGVDKNTEFLMRSIAIATNGTYIFLTDHSGIGNSHIEPTIGEYQVEYLNELILKVIKEYAALQ